MTSANTRQKKRDTFLRPLLSAIAGATLFAHQRGRDPDTAQTLPTTAEDALDAVVPKTEPGGQLHVGQDEISPRQRVDACLDGTVAGKPIGVQRLRAGLSRGNKSVKYLADVFIGAATKFIHTWDFDPEASQFLLHNYFHLLRTVEGDTGPDLEADSHVPRKENRVR